MALKLLLSMLLSFILLTTNAQVFRHVSLNIGDSAPPLRVKEWLKGKPIYDFERGKVYVVEFWATWCGPCIYEMPHLSSLARKYRNQIKIIGVDIHEEKIFSLQKVKRFIDSMGRRMNINVAVDDSDYMVKTWYEASGDEGIPKSFVVNTEGRVAWVGHPAKLAGILYKIVNGNWDIEQALAERKLNIHLEQEDLKANEKLNPYEGRIGENFYGNPDSALLIIDEIVKKEAGLKFAPFVAYHTFSALLQINPDLAYEYGKQCLITTTYADPPYNEIINNIELIANTFASPPKIYELGVEAYQALINLYPYHMSTPKVYTKMAEWYMRANNKPKAKRSLKKAIKLIKKSKGEYWSGFL